MSRRNKIIAVTRLIQRRREKQKRLWVHPIVSERLLVGAFVTLYSKLREDEIKFSITFSFDELHHKLENALKLSDTVRVSISSVERLSHHHFLIFSVWLDLLHMRLLKFSTALHQQDYKKKIYLLCLTHFSFNKYVFRYWLVVIPSPISITHTDLEFQQLAVLSKQVATKFGNNEK
nr:unnamed protein product [Callosobruchus chinensis]